MENIKEMLKRLPAGYEKSAVETGAITRKREIKGAYDLLLLVFLYVVQGLSHIEVSVIAIKKGIAEISDVGFMKRFGKCGKYMEWLIENLRPEATARYKKPKKYEIKGSEASVVTSGGKARKTHRLHYMTNIFQLKCEQYKITTEETGESMTNFEVKGGDLHICDRAYGTKTSMEHCLRGGGDFIFRIRKNAFNIYDKNGVKVDLIKKLTALKSSRTLSLRCYFRNSEKKLVPVRICAMHKPKDLVDEPNGDTEFMNNFIVVVTSVADKNITAKDILDLYRLRWQVDLYFKRLKSLTGFGDIPNKTEKHIKIWLDAKLAAAILLEITAPQVDFSPSG